MNKSNNKKGRTSPPESKPSESEAIAGPASVGDADGGEEKVSLGIKPGSSRIQNLKASSPSNLQATHNKVETRLTLNEMEEVSQEVSSPSNNHLSGWRKKFNLTSNPSSKLRSSAFIYIYFGLICIIFLAISTFWYIKGVSKSTPKVIFEVTKNVHSGMPMRLPVCHRHKVSYPYGTSLPNALGQSDQVEINERLSLYEPIISVKCYSFLPLFLCSLYAPKCNSSGHTIPVCRSVCKEATRRCSFFLPVFTLKWPIDLSCDSLPDSPDPDVCVGSRENQLFQRKHQVCGSEGFRCDSTRCIRSTWICDGYKDCIDGSDEKNCSNCDASQFYCGSKVCINRNDICDGLKDCVDGRDERQCLRLSKSMGGSGEGRLEAWSAIDEKWHYVCGENWNTSEMSRRACRMLVYKTANETRLRDETVKLIQTRAGSTYHHESSKVMFYKERKDCRNGSQVTVQLKCNDFECGKSSVSENTFRIVGGKESKPGQWPWLAGLHGGPDEVFFCGGVLISQHWILSAAHCIGNQTDPSGWTIKLGLTRRTSSPFFVRKLHVSTVIKHPAFNSANMYANDISLLLLEKPVDFDEFLRPICLPPDDYILQPGVNCTVTGWGKSMHDEDADYLPVIHEVNVPVVDHTVCSHWYSEQDVPIANSMLCAGYAEGKKDACQGDSGGPLLCRKPKHPNWYVAGVMSWGINCAQPNLPGIYTDVLTYKKWIHNVTSQYGFPL